MWRVDAVTLLPPQVPHRPLVGVLPMCPRVDATSLVFPSRFPVTSRPLCGRPKGTLMIDFPLPPMDGVFGDVPDAARIDVAELNRLDVLIDRATDGLDLDELDRLAERVAGIAARHMARLNVIRAVRRVDRLLRLRRAQVSRRLAGKVA